jgi:transcriptional regulator with XRE-family HTH domain
LLKYQLLDEVFTITGNQDMDVIKSLEYKLLNYLEVNGNDLQIKDTLGVLKIFVEESQNNDFEACCDIAAPIFERLSDADNWDFYDIRILTRVVDYIGTFDKVCELAEKLLEKLEEHSHEERYTIIKLSILMNTIVRLLRAKYFDSDNLIPSGELTIRFADYFNAALAICEEEEFPVHKAVLQIRKGLFYQDINISNRGFRKLMEMGEKEVLRMMQAVVAEYDFFTGIGLSKKQFNRIVGENIKKKRLANGLTTADLGKILDLNPSSISSAEKGDISMSSFNIYKLSNLFDVSVDYFYQGIEDKTYAPSYRKALLKKLGALVDELSDDQLDKLILTAKGLPQSKTTAS